MNFHKLDKGNKIFFMSAPNALVVKYDIRPKVKPINVPKTTSLKVCRFNSSLDQAMMITNTPKSMPALVSIGNIIKVRKTL